MFEQPVGPYDVVIIGGGPAGLSGAVTLGRVRRSVVVIDAGKPRNAAAEGVHGLLGLDGIGPGELLDRGRAEVHRYGGTVVAGHVSTAANDGNVFTVTLDDGRLVSARRILVTAGLVDQLPDIAGLRDRWGRDVLHCPYCHGWEVRDEAIGVLSTGAMSVHQALLFRQLSSDVTYFIHTATPPTAEQTEELAARGIRVIDGEVASVETEDDRLAGVRLRDGTVVGRRVLAVVPRMTACAEFLTALGLQCVEHESGGKYIPTGPAGRTESPGIWAAGNVTDLTAQVGAAATAGAMAAAAINADLLAEDTRREVAAYRDPFSARFEACVCELVTDAGRRHGV